MPIAAIAPIVLLALAFIAYCLLDLRSAEALYLPKWAWAVIICLSVPAGGIVYLAIGKKA